jgi:hypothetical protein
MANMEAMGRQEEFVTSANNLQRDDISYQNQIINKKPAIISLNQKALDYQNKHGTKSALQ